MKKMLIIIVISMFFSSFNHVIGATEVTYNNICSRVENIYCNNVGKTAYNGYGNAPALRGVKLGKIIGVTYKKKGAAISISEAIPEAGIPETVRTAPRDAFYYIIEDGWGSFLRECREIDAK